MGGEEDGGEGEGRTLVSRKGKKMPLHIHSHQFFHWLQHPPRPQLHKLLGRY